MKKVTKITIQHLPDYDADLSWLGTFSNEAESDLAIEHNGNAREYKYFNPQRGACENKEQAQRDYERMMAYERGDWMMIGIKADAEVQSSQDGKTWKIDHITSAGLWGIESDSDDAYKKEEEQNQLAELEQTLQEYGFMLEDIREAQVIYPD